MLSKLKLAPVRHITHKYYTGVRRLFISDTSFQLTWCSLYHVYMHLHAPVLSSWG